MHQGVNVKGSAEAACGPRAPALLVELPRRRDVFFSNLSDTVFRIAPVQPVLTSSPADFWSDVFVPYGVPWRRIIGSTLYQLVLFGFAIALTQIWMHPAPRVHIPIDHGTLTYYKVSEYLPPVNTGESATRSKPQRGEAAYAKQEIKSLPPLHDNTHQTIITPGQIKLPNDVSMPNLVAWTAMPGPAPAEAIADRQKTPQLTFTPVAPPPDATAATPKLLTPMLPMDVAAPAPNALQAADRTRIRGLQESVVQPPPDPTGRSRVQMPKVGDLKVVQPPPSIEAAHSRSRLPNLPAPSVVQPPVEAAGVRNVGAMNIAHMKADVAAPKLPTAEQRTVAAGSEGAQSGNGNGATAPMMIRSAAGSGTRSAAVTPPPAASVGGSHGSSAVGQVIALSVHPALPNGPINVPAGSRYGEFAAGPTGKPDAPGTPEIKATSSSDAAGGNGNGLHNAPPGITVGAGSAQPNSPVVVATNAPPPPTPLPAATPNVRRALMAAAMPTRVDELARRTRPSAPAPEHFDEVFGTRKFYTMQLNMPNLASQGGSWIIRFAEMKGAPVKEGELTAPVVTQKVDPKYPPDAIHDRIEGTVVLYAVIHKDGTVGEVRVLHGLDSRLDENACAALIHWHFLPGTKNGSAVDLEAVVQIPFQSRKLPF